MRHFWEFSPQETTGATKLRATELGQTLSPPNRRKGNFGVLQLELTTSLLVVRLTLLSPPAFLFRPPTRYLLLACFSLSPVPLCWSMGKKGKERKKEEEKGQNKPMQ